MLSYAVLSHLFSLVSNSESPLRQTLGDPNSSLWQPGSHSCYANSVTVVYSRPQMTLMAPSNSQALTMATSETYRDFTLEGSQDEISQAVDAWCSTCRMRNVATVATIYISSIFLHSWPSSSCPDLQVLKNKYPPKKWKYQYNTIISQMRCEQNIHFLLNNQSLELNVILYHLVVNMGKFN